jgi:NAD(P)-dependent dehydrogenase (short-subunit alcohol dehydrogenase family)
VEQPKVVLLTGANGGIGSALVQELKDRDYLVIATARRESFDTIPQEVLDALNGCGEIRPLDVTNDAERQKLVKDIHRRFGGVDILVNNAGACVRGTMEDVSSTELEDVLRINCVGPMALIRLVLPHMRQQHEGRIVNVSSLSGQMAMPTMGSYSASKAALGAASEALYFELKPWGIVVTVVQPAFVNSKSFRNTRMTIDARKSVEEEGPYYRYYEHMDRFITAMMSHAIATPEYVATRIRDAMERKDPPLWYTVSPDGKALDYMRKLLPQKLFYSALYSNLPKIDEWVPTHNG